MSIFWRSPQPALGGAQVCKSGIRQGSAPHFDLSVVHSNIEARLWVYGRSVNDMTILKIKSGSVIRTLNTVIHQLTV
jgi:hypothetical protein